jgi:protein-S-isoprenylcysteine O-methyltransferase Ste14
MQKEILDSAPSYAGSKAIAVGCYLAAGLGQVGLLGLLAVHGLGFVDGSQQPGSAMAWAVNLGLLLLFGLQHSGMARSGFKRCWTLLLPACLERAIYVGLSGVVLAALCLLWQPLGGAEIWHLPWPFAAVALAGGLGMIVIALRHDYGDALGIRRLWFPNEAFPDQLQITGVYRWVRHPLMTCNFVLLWGWPIMSPTLALLSGGLTMYILVSRPLEEGALIARFGDAYRAYRRRVPAYIPWRRPAPAAVAEK